jgi:hypothetical protein
MQILVQIERGESGFASTTSTVSIYLVVRGGLKVSTWMQRKTPDDRPSEYLQRYFWEAKSISGQFESLHDNT